MNLHLGCGPIHFPGFINIDKEESHNPDLCLDYLELPASFKESADAIYSCHSIEHLDYPVGVLKFFEVCYWALIPGGALRVVVPDLGKVAKEYAQGSDLRHIYDGPFFYFQDCPAERFLFFMREWEHSIVFDEELLRSFFEGGKFKDVRKMPFTISRKSQLSGLDRYETESICMEGTK